MCLSSRKLIGTVSTDKMEFNDSKTNRLEVSEKSGSVELRGQTASRRKTGGGAGRGVSP